MRADASPVTEAIPIDPQSWDEGCRRDPVRNEFVIPTVRRIIERHGITRAIDVGCGTGYIARELSASQPALPAKWTLLDSDENVLSFAASSGGSLQDAEFVSASLQAHARQLTEAKYDLAVVCYTLVEVEALDGFAESLRSIVDEGFICVFVPDAVPDIVDHYSSAEATVPPPRQVRGVFELSKVNSFTNQVQTYLARQAIDYLAALVDDETRLRSITSYVAPNEGRHFAILLERHGVRS